MRIPGRFVTATTMFVLALCIGASDAGERTGRSAALPNPEDLVTFDDSPITTLEPFPMAGDEHHHAAFPVFYGSLPVTDGVTSSAPIIQTAPQNTALPPPPLASAPAAAPVATYTSSSEGFVDYQEYLEKQSSEDHTAVASAAAPGVEPTPPPPALPDLNPAEPVPLPPPAELLAQAQQQGMNGGGISASASGATPAARPSPEPPPVIGTSERPRPDASPAVPPPLPELPAARPDNAPAPEAPAPRPAPTVEQVQADFSQLRSFCETDNLGSAAEIYARMPDFGANEEFNRLRADGANLLILALARTGNLPAARRIYISVPVDMPGFDARLAKARAVINLTTYYVRANQFNDAYSILMDVGRIPNRSALNNELFRLMARMIPYLDNAEETDKARQIYDLLLSEVKSPGTAALFAENVRASVLNYYFPYVDKSDSPIHRRKRLDFLEHMFSSLDRLESNADIRALKRTIGEGLAERYAGDPDRADRFHVE